MTASGSEIMIGMMDEGMILSGTTAVIEIVREENTQMRTITTVDCLAVKEAVLVAEMGDTSMIINLDTAGDAFMS
jgi:hypothetical protein